MHTAGAFAVGISIPSGMAGGPVGIPIRLQEAAGVRCNQQRKRHQGREHSGEHPPPTAAAWESDRIEVSTDQCSREDPQLMYTSNRNNC
jgi:hypothetical protein